MWGYGNTANISPIGNFKQAKERYETTTPIRGRQEDVRPIGKNRRYSDHRIVKNVKAIEEEGNPLGKFVESYSAKLYRTDCIEWDSEGYVRVGTGGWRSPTTLGFINYTLQNRIGTITSHSGKWYLRNYSDGMDYFIGEGKENRLVLKATGNHVQTNGGMCEAYDAVNPIQEYRYKANRKALNALRKKYKSFIEYGSNMLAIDDKLTPAPEGSWYNCIMTWHNWKNETAVANRQSLTKELDEFIESGDLEIAYKLVNKIGHAFGYYGRTCSKAEFVKGITEVLKYEFKHQVFTATPVTIGEAFYDRNEKYFRN